MILCWKRVLNTQMFGTRLVRTGHKWVLSPRNSGIVDTQGWSSGLVLMVIGTRGGLSSLLDFKSLHLDSDQPSNRSEFFCLILKKNWVLETIWHRSLKTTPSSQVSRERSHDISISRRELEFRICEVRNIKPMSVGVMKEYKLKLRNLRDLIHWVGLGTGTPKDKDEINKREVCECEGWVWDLDAIDTPPSRLRLIRKVAGLDNTLIRWWFIIMNQ